MLCKESQSPEATHSMILFKQGYLRDQLRTTETRLVILFDKESGRREMCGGRSITLGILIRTVHEVVQI